MAYEGPTSTRDARRRANEYKVLVRRRPAAFLVLLTPAVAISGLLATNRAVFAISNNDASPWQATVNGLLEADVGFLVAATWFRPFVDLRSTSQLGRFAVRLWLTIGVATIIRVLLLLQPPWSIAGDLGAFLNVATVLAALIMMPLLLWLVGLQASRPRAADCLSHYSVNLAALALSYHACSWILIFTAGPIMGPPTL